MLRLLQPPPTAPPPVAPGRAEAARSTDRSLLASQADGAAYGAMVGLGETYLPAFVLAVGLGEITAGLVASVPLLAGGLMQTVSPAAVRWLGSHKRWVLLCAMVQAISFVPLVAAALVGRIGVWGVMLVATVYWGTALATGPAWNTWIDTLVPTGQRANFFARRTRLAQAAVLIGFVAGGVLLQVFTRREATLLAFALLFLMAGAFRLFSWCMLLVQSEPVPIPANMRRMSPLETWRHIRQRQSGQLIRYLVAVQGAVQFAGPYFVPYMLAKLQLSYTQFILLVGCAYVAKILSLDAWGRYANRLGPARLLWVGGIGITPIAALWLISSNVIWLAVIQVVAGVVWGAYELAFFLLFFESIPQEERTAVLTLYNLANTTAWVAGSVLGGLVLYAFSANTLAYFALFAVSSAARGLALGLLRRQPESTFEVAPIGVRTLAVRPMSATVDAPILPSMPDQVS